MTALTASVLAAVGCAGLSYYITVRRETTRAPESPAVATSSQEDRLHSLFQLTDSPFAFLNLPEGRALRSLLPVTHPFSIAPNVESYPWQYPVRCSRRIISQPKGV